MDAFSILRPSSCKLDPRPIFMNWKSQRISGDTINGSCCGTLVEWLVPIPMVPGSTLAISKFNLENKGAYTGNVRKLHY